MSKLEEKIELDNIKNLDEISNNALEIYMQKSGKDYGHSEAAIQGAKNKIRYYKKIKHPDYIKLKNDLDNSIVYHKKNKEKRSLGMELASNKMWKNYKIPENIENEQLDEISKKTLGNYIKGATKDIKFRNNRMVDDKSSSGGKRWKRYIEDWKKTQNRYSGIPKATDKLTKENEEDLLSLAYTAKPLEFKDKFNDEMLNRITTLVNAKQADIGSNLLNEPENDELDLSNISKEELEFIYNEIMEDEQLDEISKKTLGSYIKKAKDNYSDSIFQVAKSKPGTPHFKKFARYANNREIGLNLAKSRLTKEEQLNEISKDLVGKYIKKARSNYYDMLLDTDLGKGKTRSEKRKILTTLKNRHAGMKKSRLRLSAI